MKARKQGEHKNKLGFSGKGPRHLRLDPQGRTFEQVPLHLRVASGGLRGP